MVGGGGTVPDDGKEYPGNLTPYVDLRYCSHGRSYFRLHRNFRWSDVNGFILEEIFPVFIQEAYVGRWFDKPVLQIRQPNAYFVYVIIVLGCTIVVPCYLHDDQKTWDKIVNAVRRFAVLCRGFYQWLCSCCLDAHRWPYVSGFWNWIC